MRRIVSSADKRDANGRFLVGNPGGGRPRRLDELTVPIGEMREEHLERLRVIAREGEHRDSIAAIKLMWSYRYGNPPQAFTVEDVTDRLNSVVDLDQLTADELAALQTLKAAKRRLETARKDEP